MKEKSLILNNNYCHHLHVSENNPSLFFNPVIQPKLTINNPNDKFEQEADAMADKVMRMQQPGMQLKPLSITGIQRKCDNCEGEEKVQRKENNTNETTTDNNLENYVGSLSSGGQPLSNDVRSFYEPRFGYNFSNVKVHTDSVAAKSAQSINALAYTSGNNIVFNNAQYSPNTDSGKRLLGHELTHVVQQDTNFATSNIQRACSPIELSSLHSEMHSYCNLPRSCNMQTDTCASATAKVAAGYGCTSLRTQIQQRCFRPGDVGYHTHMQQIAEAYAALLNCQSVMSAKCSTSERIKEFARRVITEGLDAEQAAEDFLRQNPTLAWSIVILGSVGIIALIADDATLVGIADDVLVPVIGVLVRIAWRFAI